MNELECVYCRNSAVMKLPCACPSCGKKLSVQCSTPRGYSHRVVVLVEGGLSPAEADRQAYHEYEGTLIFNLVA
jgi:hypothetical protein